MGNIRTALFNWLFARRYGGVFVLRIEDTDRNRLVPGAQDAILETLRWLGLDWDEGPEAGGAFGPYIQSERTELGIYERPARNLIENGWAYECYCPPERLDAVRKEQQRQKLPPMYDRWCRDTEKRDEMRRQHPDTTPVVRFKAPYDDGGETGFADLVLGQVSIANRTLDDFVLLKSDGYPTYHLANVVDDHMMEMTHVIRGDDWVPSTPRHVLLYRALGWEPPLFAHLPMVLGPDRSRFSKRHGATAALEYRDLGFLPEAMSNFLALLGWSLDDKTEILSRAELVRHFSIDRVGKTGAVFNVDKLEWMNGMYIRALSPAELADRLLPFIEAPQAGGGLPNAVYRPVDRAYLARMVPLIQERLKVLKEAASLIDFFFLESFDYDPQVLAGKQLSREQAADALQRALIQLEQQREWTHEALEAALRPMAEELGLKVGPFFGVLRVAVTGRTISPPLFETMDVLGGERTLKRMREALAALVGGA